MLNTRTAVAALVVAAASGAACAQQAILSFGFTDLNGSYVLAGSTFQANGQAISSGDITRLQAPGGQANYNVGSTIGLVNVTMNVSGIAGPTANGAGTFTILDGDAVPDSITGSITGQFIQNGPAVFFDGVLSNVLLHDNGPQDGMFNGPSGGTPFPLDFSPSAPPFTGDIIQLYVGTPGNFFTGNFSGVSTQVSGEIIPSPTSLAALGAGLLMAGRRRRR